MAICIASISGGMEISLKLTLVDAGRRILKTLILRQRKILRPIRSLGFGISMT
jgi:hypothetical protein